MTTYCENNENPPAYAPIVTAPAYAPTVMQNNSTVNYGDNQQTEHEVTYIPEAYVVLGPSSGSASQAPTNHQPVKTNPSAPTTTTSNPPPNCPDGGLWGTLQYTGNKTGAFICVGCIFFGLFGLCFLACPQDEKDAYCVNGRLYDAAGVYISTKSNFFIPSRRR